MSDKKTQPLSEAARKAKNEYQRKYQREYRKKNPERVKQHQNSYWERKAEKQSDNGY
jgi:hypothetical protein